MTQVCSFLWLSNIPLYVCPTVTQFSRYHFSLFFESSWVQPIFYLWGAKTSSSCHAFSLIYSYPYNWCPMLYAFINLSNQLANSLLSPLKKKSTFSNKAVSINDDLNLHGTVYSPLVGEREDILRAQILDRTITQCPELPAGRGWHRKSSGMEGPKGANGKDDRGLPWPSTAGGVDSIPGRGTEIRHAMLCG